MDSERGAVLFEKAADELTPPASMAKLMTALVLFDEMAKGRVTPDTEFVISEQAWRRGRRAVRRFNHVCALNSRIKVADCLPADRLLAMTPRLRWPKGLPVRSKLCRDDDARVRAMGLTKAPSAMPPDLPTRNRWSTARELALIAHAIIKTYPDQYPVFGLREFTLEQGAPDQPQPAAGHRHRRGRAEDGISGNPASASSARRCRTISA